MSEKRRATGGWIGSGRAAGTDRQTVPLEVAVEGASRAKMEERRQTGKARQV